MSTILKALKSLEAEGTEGRGKTGRSSPTAHGGARNKGRYRCAMWVLAGIGLLCLSAAGGVLFHFSISGENRYQAQGPSGSDTRKAEYSTEKSPKLAQSRMPVRASASDPDTSGEQMALLQNKGRKAQPVIKRAKEKRPPENSVREKLYAAPPGNGAQKETLSGENSSVERFQVLKTPRLPELKEPGLILQAISWDRDPGRRIAVINSRLCREGDVLEGFTVLSITPDDVSLVRGETRGRLVFTGR